MLAVAALVALASGLVLLAAGAAATTRALPGWWRLLALPAGLAVLVFGIYPLTAAVYATNTPASALRAATPADRGLAYQDVTLSTSDQVTLSGWYVPSANHAAVVLLHGSGSTRSDVLDHAAVLARHGYGVLLLDARGHGRSGGHAMEFGWYGERDISAAVDWLQARADIDPLRIGAVGMSMGGEEAVGAAGSDPRIRAVVGEGVTGRQPADHGWLPHGVEGLVQRGLEYVLYTAADVLSGASRPISLPDAVAAAAPRSVLLVAAGSVPEEVAAAESYRAVAPATVSVWVVPGAGHTGGLATRPAEWTAVVTAFLDRTLMS